MRVSKLRVCGPWWAMVLVWLLCVASAPAAASAAAPTLSVTGAEFRFLVETPTEDQRVDLPHTWRGGRPEGTARGRYLLAFDLVDIPLGGLSARFDRLGASRRVWLNGHYLGAESRLGAHHLLPGVIGLPAGLLQSGRNELVLELSYRSGGGLSAMTVGDPFLQQRAHDQSVVLARELPRSLNMAMMALSMVMLLVWWRRRTELSIGLFGMISSVGSLRNYMYFNEYSVVPSAATNWLFYAVQVWTLVLFVAFTRSLLPSLQRNRWLNGALYAAAVLLPGAAVVASWADRMDLMRTVTYPLLLLATLGSVLLLWRVARRRKDSIHYALAIVFTLVLLAGAHDHLFFEGVLAVTHAYWTPFVMPFALGIYAVMTMGRLVDGVAEAERLNGELEQRVAERTRALQAANATKTRFLASASHDLRQPVAAIGLMVSLLRERVASGPVRTLVDRVDEAVASMEMMLRGLLDLSRLESGSVRARTQLVPLQPIFDAIALHETEAAERKGIYLRFRPTSLSVLADPILLDQVLRNLVSNAVRYTEVGGVLVSARGREPDAVLLQVWDTGIGMTPSEQEVVFDEFVQVGNAARQRSRGQGLGLAIVRRSAAVMGCSLQLRSVPGSGSCFGLQLPRAAGERRRQSRSDPKVDQVPLAGCRICVVEDDGVVREGLVERLQAWGATVCEHDGMASLRQAMADWNEGETPPLDLLLTDHRLPGSSGLEVIDMMRSRFGWVPAMVVTGDTSPGDLGRLQSSGVPVLHKPFRMEALLTVVQQALATSSPLRGAEV